MLELSIEGGTHGEENDLAEETFEISPAIIYNQKTRFVISVKKNKYLDFEKLQKVEFKVNLFKNLSFSSKANVFCMDLASEFFVKLLTNIKIRIWRTL